MKVTVQLFDANNMPNNKIEFKFLNSKELENQSLPLQITNPCENPHYREKYPN
jgi:hypothetical protein